jgi:diguanylate cyclase (GGDEF)-like protein
MHDAGTRGVEDGGRASARIARKAVQNFWRAVRSTPKSHLYPVLGMLLALAVPGGLFVAYARSGSTDLATTYVTLTFATVALSALLGYVLGRQFDEMRLRSITDPLTGLYNRRHFGQRLSEETKRARRYGHTASVVCLDVDRLKAINDGFGHRAGDGALVAVCRALRDNVRTIDVVARIGGDEFAVLLPETSAAQASALSQRILAEVAWQGDLLDGGLAVSIGIAELDAANDLEADDLLVAADDALYQAKAAGGGHVAVAQPEPSAPPTWSALAREAGGTAW